METRVRHPRRIRHRQLIPHVPGKILVVSLPLVRLRVQENEALQIGQKFTGGLVQQTGHVIEVNPALLVQRHQERFLRFADG